MKRARIKAWPLKTGISLRLVSILLSTQTIVAQNERTGFTEGAVECTIDGTDIVTVVVDKDGKIQHHFDPWFSMSVNENQSNTSLLTEVQMKKCWCARLFLMNKADDYFCPLQMDTCTVTSNGRNVACTQKNTMREVARNIFPFGLLLTFISVLFLVKSESGRFAREFATRHSRIAMKRLRKVCGLPERQNEEDEESVPPEIDTRGIPSSTEGSILGNEETEQRIEVTAPGETRDVEGMTRIATESVQSQVTFPSIFGNHDNYQALKTKLDIIIQEEPELVSRIWHSAWVLEHRRRIRNQRWERIRTFLGFNAVTSSSSDENADDVVAESSGLGNMEQTSLHLELKTKKFKNETEEKTCAICLSELLEGEIVGNIPCQHFFHKDCLKSWVTRSNKCPLCQQEGIISVKLSRGTLLSDNDQER